MQQRGGRQYPENLCLKGKTTLFCTRNHNRSALVMKYVVVFFAGVQCLSLLLLFIYLKTCSEPSFIKKTTIFGKERCGFFVVFSVSELRFFSDGSLAESFQTYVPKHKRPVWCPKKNLSPEVPQVHWFGPPQCLPNCARGRGAQVLGGGGIK